MAKNKFQWKRPELSLQEVTEQKDCTVEDLFHAAALGELTIYVRADGWKVACIGSIKQVALSVLTDQTNKINKDDIEAVLPEFKEIKSKDDAREKGYVALSRLSEELEKFSPPDELKDIISLGPMTFYPNSGIYRASYILPLFGFQPISVGSMAIDRKDTGGGIWLKLIDDFGISENSTDEFFICPDRVVTLQDALKDGNLFVMKEDLQNLTSDPDDAKPKGGVNRNTLLKMIIGMAIKGYNYDPAAKRSNTSSEIEKDLKDLKIGLDDDPIRKALKEAATLIPPPPAPPANPQKT